MEKSHFSVDDFQIRLLKTDIELTIEAENQIKETSYALKITTDVVPELSNYIFNDINELMTGLVGALDKSTQDTTITIIPDEKLKFSHRTMIGKLEKALSFVIVLQKSKLGLGLSDQEKNSEEEITGKMKTWEEILRSSLTNFEKQLLRKFEEQSTRINDIEGRISDRLDVLEKKMQEIACKGQISPFFNPNDINKFHFVFSNNNKTITYRGESKYFCPIFAEKMLPINGRQEFSLKIEVSTNNGHGIRIGMASIDHRSSTGFMDTFGYGYFFDVGDSSLRSPGSINAPKSAHEKPAEGKIVTVIIDSDSNEICFKVDGVEFHKIDVDVTYTKLRELYPCVGMQSTNDSVSFV